MGSNIDQALGRINFFFHRTLRSLIVRSPRYLGNIDAWFLKQYLLHLNLKNVSSIPTHTSKRELAALFNLAIDCQAKAIALEIGSYLGASACYLAAGLARVNGHLYCVDSWQNETMPEGERDTYHEFLSNTCVLQPWITPLRKHSETLSGSDLQLPLRLAFIDGDHSYASVREDFQRILPWMAEDGIVAFHDANRTFEGVTRVIGEALASGDWAVAGMVESLTWLKRN